MFCIETIGETIVFPILIDSIFVKLKVSLYKLTTFHLSPINRLNQFLIKLALNQLNALGFLNKIKLRVKLSV